MFGNWGTSHRISKFKLRVSQISIHIYTVTQAYPLISILYLVLLVLVRKKNEIKRNEKNQFIRKHHQIFIEVLFRISITLLLAKKCNL
jgi:hypothetical protein